MNQAESQPQRHTPCRQLRSKEMYYQSPGEQEDQFSSGIYWCSHTHKCLGPDGMTVSKDDCGQHRSCFEQLIQVGQSDPPPL